MAVTSQVCTQCGVDKPFSEYHRDQKNKRGYRRKCKSCVLVYQKARRSGERVMEPVKSVRRGRPEIHAKGGKKLCTKCLQTKGVDEFYRNKGNKDGYQYYCKPCFNYMSKESKKKRRSKRAGGPIASMSRRTSRSGSLNGRSLPGKLMSVELTPDSVLVTTSFTFKEAVDLGLMTVVE